MATSQRMVLQGAGEESLVPCYGRGDAGPRASHRVQLEDCSSLSGSVHKVLPPGPCPVQSDGHLWNSRVSGWRKLLCLKISPSLHSPDGPSPPVPAGEVVPVEGAELLLQAEDAECQVGGGHDQQADPGWEEQLQCLRASCILIPPPPAHLQHDENLEELVVGGSQLCHAALLCLQLFLCVYCTFCKVRGVSMDSFCPVHLAPPAWHLHLLVPSVPSSSCPVCPTPPAWHLHLLPSIPTSSSPACPAPPAQHPHTGTALT